MASNTNSSKGVQVLGAIALVIIGVVLGSIFF